MTEVMYPAILGHEPGQEISVVFPDLDVATSGITEADAMMSARELLRCVLHGLQADGQPFPAPTAWKDLPVGPNEKAVLVTTDIDPELDPSDHGANCAGNPDCCDECDHLIACSGWAPGKIWDEERQTYI